MGRVASPPCVASLGCVRHVTGMKSYLIGRRMMVMITCLLARLRFGRIPGDGIRTFLTPGWHSRPVGAQSLDPDQKQRTE